MIVVDASAIVTSFQDPQKRPEAETARLELEKDNEWAVPEHWLIECINAIRGLWLAGEFTTDEALRAVKSLSIMTTKKFDIEPLATRIWELRSNLTAYDAAYVALAERLKVVLVTGDGKIEKAGVARCPIIVV